MADERLPLLVLCGPTATGKTALAIRWAQAVGAEIVAADSTTVYRGLDIGTAKPTPAERALVPHHLLDIVDPVDTYSVARFQADATRAIQDIHARGRLPLMVGGTGLFIRSVVQAYPFAPPTDPALRARIQSWVAQDGLAAVRRKLRLVDPDSFRAIASTDARRIVRALEVFLGTGQRLPRRPAPLSPYRTLMVGLTRPRDELRRRIRDRAAAQLAHGLLDEVLALLRRGVPWNAPAMTALGYREGVQWARGRLADHEVLPLMVLHTQQYAKRQLTWFRRERAIRWIDMGSTSEDDALTSLVSWTADLLSGKTPAPQSEW